MDRLLTRAVRVARDPVGAWERYRDDRDRRREYAGEPPVYRPSPDWQRQLHELMGAAYPCAAAQEFAPLWQEIAAFVAGKGIRFGPESFYGWNDGDPEFCRALWCLVRHRRPSRIVEAGVAHGISSRVMLEALERNGCGELWSIDPPPVDPRLAAEIGIAVDAARRERWHLVRGTSRRVLPGLLAQLGQIDLFVHDSLHTRRNVCFEVAHAGRALCPEGLVVIDDIDTNWGFHELTQTCAGGDFVICQSNPVRPDLRRFDQKGLFGVMRPAR
jgi:predicted O-methyltransferase YrrM